MHTRWLQAEPLERAFPRHVPYTRPLVGSYGAGGERDSGRICDPALALHRRHLINTFAML